MASVFVLVLSPSLCWGSAESCADGVVPGYSRRAELRERNAARFKRSTVRVGEQFTRRHKRAIRFLELTSLLEVGYLTDLAVGNRKRKRWGHPCGYITH